MTPLPAYAALFAISTFVDVLRITLYAAGCGAGNTRCSVERARMTSLRTSGDWLVQDGAGCHHARIREHLSFIGILYDVDICTRTVACLRLSGSDNEQRWRVCVVVANNAFVNAARRILTAESTSFRGVC